METEPPQDLRRLVHSTANRMLEESLRNLRQHNEVRRLIARGELTDLELNAAYHDYERQAAAIYRQAVADLTSETNPQAWRRVAELLLRSMATPRTDTPLTTPALTQTETRATVRTRTREVSRR